MGEARRWGAENVAVYVINMASAPQKWENMRQRLLSLGVTPTRIPGVDVGRPGGINDAKEAGIIPRTWNYTKAQENVHDVLADTYPSIRETWFLNAIGLGTLGCAAAHLHAQRRSAELATKAGKELALVMEDDVWVAQDFAVRLRRLLRSDTPCDWAAIALTSRCSYGACISPHL